MSNVRLSVRPRTETGDGPSRRLRAAGLVPGVVYGKGKEATPIAVELAGLREALAHGHNVVLELVFDEGTGAKVGGKGKSAKRYAVVKELQFHPIRPQLLHVDLHEISLKEEIEAQVAIELVGTPAGVADGGIVDWEHREVTVRALPEDVPATLELDVSALHVGHHLTVAAIQAGPGVTIVDDPETIVVTVIPPRVQEATAEAGEASAEPEVIGGAKGE